MADTATFSFSRSGNSLFSPAEVRALMVIEFERAQRYDYSVCCLKLRVDRIVEIGTVHGQESRDEVLEAVVNLLRKATRAGDLLGFLDGDRLTVLLPHTDPRGVTFLADRLLAGARKLVFDMDDRSLRVSLSIGIAHNRHPDADSFDTMEKVAEEGVVVAEAAGGDRWAETELYALHTKHHRPAPAPVSSDPASTDVRNRLIELMADGGDLERAANTLAEELLQRAAREIEEERQAMQAEAASAPVAESDASKEAEYQREIDMLRRRVSKLTSSLGSTEREIQRLRRLKTSDDGVASIYRDVQGLEVDDERGEMKRELMSRIFEANLDLQADKRSG